MTTPIGSRILRLQAIDPRTQDASVIGPDTGLLADDLLWNGYLLTLQSRWGDSLYAEFPGYFTQYIGTLPFMPRANMYINAVTIFTGAVISGVDVVADVKKNGATIFTGAKPTITVGNQVATKVNCIPFVTIEPTDFLTVDVVSGSGSDLGMRIDYT